MLKCWNVECQGFDIPAFRHSGIDSSGERLGVHHSLYGVPCIDICSDPLRTL
jgi:hypothetical protein